MKKMFGLLSILLIASLVLAACGQPTAASQDVEILQTVSVLQTQVSVLRTQVTVSQSTNTRTSPTATYTQISIDPLNITPTAIGDQCHLNAGGAYRVWIEYATGQSSAVLKAEKCWVLLPNGIKWYGAHVKNSDPSAWEWNLALDAKGIAIRQFGGVDKNILNTGDCWLVSSGDKFFTIRCFVPPTPTP